jgi:hypothetical protein
MERGARSCCAGLSALSMAIWRPAGDVGRLEAWRHPSGADVSRGLLPLGLLLELRWLL